MHAFYEWMETEVRAFRAENMTFIEHLHKETEIIYVESGAVEVQIGSQRKLLQAGDMGIAFPNTAHSYETKTAGRAVLIIFGSGLAGDYEELLVKYKCRNPFPVKQEVHPDVPAGLKRLLDEDILRDVNLQKAYIAVIIGNLRNILELERKIRQEAQNTQDEILHFVLEHYREPISLEAVAAEVGVGKYTVSRIFNQELQCGFNQYINGLRIGYAQHLLGNRQMSVTDVAYETGFSSQRTFNRIFRDIHGISPREYRKEYM